MSASKGSADFSSTSRGSARHSAKRQRSADAYGRSPRTSHRSSSDHAGHTRSDDAGPSTPRDKHEDEGIPEVLQDIFQKYVSIPTPTQAPEWKEYKKSLTIPGLVDAQLIAAGATKEEVERYPAKIGKEDGAQYFDYLKALLSFDNVSSKGAKDKQGISTYIIDCGCNQDILDALVHAIYRKSIGVTSETAYELLAAADFLQANWLLDSFFAYFERETVHWNPIGVYRVAQAFRYFHVMEAALREVNSRDAKQLMKYVRGDNLDHQLHCMDLLTEYNRFTEVLRIMDDFEAAGGWSLKKQHIHLLCDAFDEQEDVCEYMRERSGPLYERLHRKRPQKSPAAPQQRRVFKSKWTVALKDVDAKRGLLCCENPIVGKKEQSYWPSLQLDDEDEWGIFVRVDDVWEKGDEVKISIKHNSNPEKVKSAEFKVSAHPEIVGTTLQQGWPGLFDRWADREDFRSSCGRYVSIYFEIHTRA